MKFLIQTFSICMILEIFIYSGFSALWQRKIFTKKPVLFLSKLLRILGKVSQEKKMGTYINDPILRTVSIRSTHIKSTSITHWLNHSYMIMAVEMLEKKRLKINKRFIKIFLIKNINYSNLSLRRKFYY